jgi:hypothetical protein
VAVEQPMLALKEQMVRLVVKVELVQHLQLQELL